MYPYLPITEENEREMLQSLGLKSVADLFFDIPENVRFNGELNFPKAKSEIEVRKILGELASKNKTADDMACFLGAGAYDHYIPSLVDAIISRSEFYTSYTPYQPEVAQGTLQYIFEYQTLMCNLTGMDVSNASLYDGGTAVTEAALMALGVNRKREVLVSKSVNPSAREILKTYCHFQNLKVTEIEIEDGETSLSDLKSKITPDVGAVIVQSPNFFGIIEDYKKFVDEVHESKKCSLILSTDLISLGILKRPGDLGVDIVVGEGQGMGMGMSFGGPYLGFICANEKFMRKLPGRIVGETVDREGKRSYVLTLTAREQHIRREKATSNICSNQGLNVLAATIYLVTMGKKGIREVAYQSLQKSHYLKGRLKEKGFNLLFDKPFFKEFAVDLGKDVDEVNKKLIDEGIIGGYNLVKSYGDLKNASLFAVTEKRTKEEMDKLTKVLGGLK